MPHPVQTYSLSGGIELSFTDSGAPLNSIDYTTLLVIHGLSFNAYQFQKLHSYAHALNLRIVLLHRRDYAGSTPYSPAELEEISRGDKVFWERLSAQVVEFLVLFIKQEKIPKLTLSESQSEGPQFKGRGGMAILGWSMGCSTVLSLFGVSKNPLLAEGLYNVLKEYVGTFILYDPPYLAFGYPLPQDNPNYSPLDDQTLAGSDILKIFVEWVSSYFDHPCYEPHSQSLAYTASIHDLDGRRETERNSISSWTEEETMKGIEGDKANTELLMFLPAMQETLRVLAYQALFDGEAIQRCFPDVSVAYLGVTRTTWACAWGEIETKKRYYGAISSFKQVRNIKFFDICGANHFLHWDQTPEFLEVVRKGIYSQ